MSLRYEYVPANAGVDRRRTGRYPLHCHDPLPMARTPRRVRAIVTPAPRPRTSPRSRTRRLSRALPEARWINPGPTHLLPVGHD